mgnify:CR=1 FL=1
MVSNLSAARKVNDDPRHRGTKRALLVAHQIVDEIGRSDLDVGDKLLPEQEMLIRYGVARATLREALRFLELQGVMPLKGRRRTTLSFCAVRLIGYAISMELPQTMSRRTGGSTTF